MPFKNPIGAPRKPKLDLTGLVFGRLTVKSYTHVEVRPTGRWVCECVCGKEVIVATAMLKNGHTKGCNTCPRIKDITGEKFGWLIVSGLAGQKTHPNGRTESTWLCDCVCGSRTVVSLSNLRSGGTKSCGCLFATMKGERPPNTTKKQPKSKSPLVALQREIRNLAAYFLWKTQVLLRDGNKCQLCHQGRSRKVTIVVHHITTFNSIISRYNILSVPQALDCDLLWDINNGMTLCTSCHKHVHSPSFTTIC